MRFEMNPIKARRVRAVAPRDWVALISLLIACVAVGCGSAQHAPDLSESVAQSSLTTALDAWKQGQTPDSLGQRSPQIIVGDTQWEAGQRLVSYKVLEPATSDGSNLHVPVELELEDGAGVRSKETVKYTVGTSPKITVFLEEPSN